MYMKLEKKLIFNEDINIYLPDGHNKRLGH